MCDKSTTNPDVTEDITKSSLPEGFASKKRFIAGQNAGETIEDETNTTEEFADVSTTTFMEKEGKMDNIWRRINTSHDMLNQRNYSRAVKKRTLEEADRFEEKVENWVREYQDFVDDGVSRKQPRF